MNELTSSTLDSFLERFYRCDDAVIRSVRYLFRGGGVGARLDVEISARDTESENGWSNIVLHLIDVAEVVFREGLTTNQIMSGGIYVGWFEGLVFVDFSPYSTEMETVEDVRRSDFHAAGRACSWEVLAYREQVT